MTGPSALAFPGSRTLAGWWRQLAPRRPLALWFAHLLLHRVEASVRVRRPFRPDPLATHLLKTLAFVTGPEGATTARLDEELRLGPQVVSRMLDELRRAGLVQVAGDGGAWEITDAGRHAGTAGEVPATGTERRSFYFLAGSPPAFLPLRPVETLPWVAGPDWGFDLNQLRDCLRRPDEWKRLHGFPADVLDLAAAADRDGDEAAAWRHVIVDYPERLPAVLTPVAGEGGPTRLLGFAVRPDNWSLRADAPALELDAWAELFPPLAADPPAAQWAQAWRAWCQPRSLPEAQTEACALERHDNVLRVHAPARLLEHLRGARGDAGKGETWILAGEGPVRKAARLEIVAARQETTAGPL